MAVFSPYHKSLYRRVWRGVILALLVLTAAVITQSQSTKRTSKGPRALGLLEFAADGKAHLIPITILSEGKFYDAGAYKAAPVPMALEPQTVYEAMQTGVSQGLFTITTARELKNNWIADGTWLPAGAAPPQTGHKAEDKPIMENEEGPPKLRRGVEKAPETSPNDTKPQTMPQGSSQPQPSTSAPPSSPSSNPTNAPAGNAPSSSQSPAQSPQGSPSQEEDRNHPTLQRGKPKRPFPPAEESAQPAGGDKKAATSSSKAAQAATAAGSSTVRLIPAISDSDGPEPRPYNYDLKPEEEQKYRQKILALAAEDIRTRARQLGELHPEPSTRSPASAKQRAGTSKGRQPTFDDVQLRFFDLSSSNEPVLVLTATARMRRAGFAPSSAEQLQYFLTLVARADIYGDLRKLFSNVTDTRHLDAIARMELIDAVDVDGDGRGELLFREISDAGKAFDVYRVTGDQLWPLFEGTPQ